MRGGGERREERGEREEERGGEGRRGREEGRGNYICSEEIYTHNIISLTCLEEEGKRIDTCIEII